MALSWRTSYSGSMYLWYIKTNSWAGQDEWHALLPAQSDCTPLCSQIFPTTKTAGGKKKRKEREEYEKKKLIDCLHNGANQTQINFSRTSPSLATWRLIAAESLNYLSSFWEVRWEHLSIHLSKLCYSRCCPLISSINITGILLEMQNL